MHCHRSLGSRQAQGGGEEQQRGATGGPAGAEKTSHALSTRTPPGTIRMQISGKTRGWGPNCKGLNGDSEEMEPVKTV